MLARSWKEFFPAAAQAPRVTQASGLQNLTGFRLLRDIGASSSRSDEELKQGVVEKESGYSEVVLYQSTYQFPKHSRDKPKPCMQAAKREQRRLHNCGESLSPRRIRLKADILLMFDITTILI